MRRDLIGACGLNRQDDRVHGRGIDLLEAASKRRRMIRDLPNLVPGRFDKPKRGGAHLDARFQLWALGPELSLWERDMAPPNHLAKFPKRRSTQRLPVRSNIAPRRRWRVRITDASGGAQLFLRIHQRFVGQVHIVHDSN